MQMQIICILSADDFGCINRLSMQGHIKNWQVIRTRRNPTDKAEPETIFKLEFLNL